MVTIMNNKRGCKAITFVGVGMLSLAAVGAVAQGRPMSGSTMNSDRGSSAMDMAEPASMNYPIAAPGGLSLYHWVSYRRDVLADGSVRDTRERQEMAMDRKLNRGSIKEDPMMIDPMPLSYPVSSPGALDLYHFRSYNGNVIVSGSVADAREDAMMAKDRQRRMETRITDDERMADPASMSYPMAAPGGLDLYHYQSYRQNTLAEGSTRDATEAKQMKLDQKRMKATGNN